MDLLSEHACEAAATGRLRHGSANVATGGRPPVRGATDKLQLDQLRDELRRGVRFTHQQGQRGDYDDLHRQGQDDEQTMPSRLSTDSRGGAMGSGHDERRMRSSLVFADDDAENDEIAAFLGLTVSTSDNQEIPLHHRAASFTAGARPRMVPCSPPVPIPQKHRLRRNSISITATSRASSGSLLLPSHEHQYSRTQCEARLWDEYWNFKLSLESRESFEASTSNNSNQRDGRESPLPGKVTPISASQDQKTKHRTISEASTEDTARDSGEELGGDAVEVDVFDMDDL